MNKPLYEITIVFSGSSLTVWVIGVKQARNIVWELGKKSIVATYRRSEKKTLECKCICMKGE